MLSRSVGYPMLAAWRPIVTLVVALAVLTPVRAEDVQKDKPGAPPKKAAEKPKTQKSQADLDKARADVKQLKGEMDKLHEQLHDTARKLWKAESVLAEQGGKEGHFGHHFARHEGRMWSHFRHAWRHGEGAWMHFGPHHVRHMGEGAEVSKLEQKVDQLQKTVEQLQHQLQGKK